MREADRDLLKTFDGVAELYDRARPNYPEQLLDDLVDLARLGAGASLLEVGCGTGRATGPLARRGFNILCLEPGASLAGVAKRNLQPFPDVEVVVESFEDWDAIRPRYVSDPEASNSRELQPGQTPAPYPISRSARLMGGCLASANG